MNIATGAMNTLLPKLAELVVGEYKLQKGVKGKIEKLKDELTSMNAALCKVAQVPVDQLDEQDRVWASDVRELSYDIEDEVDTFMLGNKKQEHDKPFNLKGLFGKATDLYKKAKTIHKIHNVIKDIMDQVKEVAERRDRYKIDNSEARPAMVAVDPRLEGMYRKATELVGIRKPKNELAKRLFDKDDSSTWWQQLNVISVVGFGGLGKTTLANSLLQDHKSDFDCHIFVSISLNPDIKKIFKNILLQLDEKEYGHINEGWEVEQLIDKIREFLKNRRCLCVIDDLWKESDWDSIKLAFQDGHSRSKMIITTRSKTVAEYVGRGVYELKPLSDDDSRKLFTKRIFDIGDGCPPSLGEVAGQILNKCGGVPLAIITTSSLLASKPMCLEEWEKVDKSFGSGLGNSLDVNKMRKILSLSYNDLPFHLKTCLLSLSKYPEDHVIRKDVLIWSWAAEGFIKEETQSAGTSPQEIGENYFSELINRSLIQPVDRYGGARFRFTDEDDGVYACRVHDMVLELINQLSSEQGFTTILSEDSPQASTLASAMQKRKIRRLSIHNSNKSYDSQEARQQLSKVRSLDIFGKVKSIPPLSSFHVLRVLQVDDCTGLEKNHLSNLGKLRHLRFLRLHCLGIHELPESIGDLESLETLDIRGASTKNIILLPVSFGKLGKLVRLHAGSVDLPDGVTLENMKCLEELVGIVLTLHTVTEIGKVRQVKVLGPVISESSRELLSMCLRMCPGLQVLFIIAREAYFLDFMAQVPSGLHRFKSHDVLYKTFPSWIHPSLSCLTALSIRLFRVCVLPEHLDKLAGLPSLRFLKISLVAPASTSRQKLLVLPCRESAFPCLTEFQFVSTGQMFITFQQGAMRKLQILRLNFDARLTNILYPTSHFDYGLENLPSLHHVFFRLRKKCPEARAAIRKAINNHPNHPSTYISVGF